MNQPSKQIFISLSTTIFLCILWTYLLEIINLFFKCEGFGCVGNAIVGFYSFLTIATLVLIFLGVYIWRTSPTNKLNTLFIHTMGILSIVIIWIGIGYLHNRINEHNNMEKTYQDCLKEPAFNKGNYCETYHQ